MKVARSSFIAFVLAIFVGLIFATPANALSGSEFRVGRIADDSVFFSTGPFDTQSIQAFLESKVPTCDTNGTKPYNSTMTRAQYGASRGSSAPYTCLRDFRQEVPSRAPEASLCNGISGGNKSGAQIIHEVSQSCGVNARVLLVLLQKEQSLITDDWPWPIQYRSATGYGCPDTAPCDEQYYGFFNQVYAAARGYKYYALHKDSFGYKAGRNNYIQYNPNTGCGGSTVYIENQATAGLYIYTPYQPNQAALNNLYGSGDGCSAYGNRNFWRMHNDWFGPTLGPLIRTVESGELFYSDGAHKYRVGSMEMAKEYGLGLNDVRFVSQNEMNNTPLASSPNTPNLSLVVKSNDDSDEDGGNIYLISSGKRLHITSMDLFSAYGFEVADIGKMPLSQLTRMPMGDTLKSYFRTYNGYLFKAEGSKKRAVLDLSTFTEVNPSQALTDISKFIADTLPLGRPVMTGDNFIKEANTGKLWLVRNDTWHYIPSINTYNCLGLAHSKIKSSSFIPYQASPGTQGESAKCIVRHSNGSIYIMDGNRRIVAQPAWGLTSTFNFSDAFITRLPTYSPTPTPVFKTQSSGALYVLDGGKKRQLISMDSFHVNGYVPNDIFTSTTNFLSILPTGSRKFHDGMVVKEGDGRVHMIVGNGRLYIGSMQLLQSYGYSNGPSVVLNAQEVTTYSQQGDLKRLVKVPAAAFIDAGVRYDIPSDLEQPYGISVSTPVYKSSVLAKVTSSKQITRYIKSNSAPNLYYVENGTKRPVNSWTTFTALGGNNSNITVLSENGASSIPTGAAY